MAKTIQFTEMLEELAPSQVRAFAHDEFPEAEMGDYNRVGVTVAEDADTDGVLNQAGWTPLHFLYYPLNKPIEILTEATVIDKICGRSIVADWETAEIIQPVVEGTGNPQLYGDDNDTPLASFNNDFEKRDVQRFELGIRVGKLEDARIAKMAPLGFKSAYDTKRGWLATSFKLLLNRIGHRGFKNGSASTFGLLNDPNVSYSTSVSTVRTNVTRWADKTFQEICADLRKMFTDVNISSGTHFDGMAGDKCKLVLSPAAKNALATENDHGKSVMQYLKENYEGCEVIGDPMFRNAFGEGIDCAMLIADELNGNKVVDQFIPKAFQLMGVYKDEKHVKEAYTCATAGVMIKQPVGVAIYRGV